MARALHIHIHDAETKHDPKSGQFTAGGLTASQHQAKSDHHNAVGTRQEAAIREKGGPRGRLGSRSEKWYTSQQHQLAGFWHGEAATHIGSGNKEKAEEAARLAEHHKPRPKWTV